MDNSLQLKPWAVPVKKSFRERVFGKRAHASFFNNLFGTIGHTSALAYGTTDPGFIPNGRNGETIRLKGEFSAAWLGLQIPLQQLYAYNFCYPLSSVVDALAEADITGILKFTQPGGKGKDNPANNTFAKSLRKLFARPNPLQSWEQFRGQQKVYKKLFGFCPVLPIIPYGFGPGDAVAMFNLPPWLFDAVPTGDILFKTDIKDIVKEYKVSIMGKSFTLQPDQVIILEDSFVQNYTRNYLLPQSRLVGLDMAVSNICAAMEADNVLLRKKGPLGFISHDAAAVKDSTAGYIPMSDDEKDELQDALQKYGLTWDQFQYVISRTAAKWNPMSYNVKELGTKDTVLAGARAICQRYHYPYVLFEDSDATFSNQESAHKKLYETNVIPNNQRDMSKYNMFFKTEENNCRIEMDYSHLTIFQEDALNTGRAAAYQSQASEIQWLNNIITFNEFRISIGQEIVTGPEGDLYYYQTAAYIADQAQKNAQIATTAEKVNQMNQNNTEDGKNNKA